MRNLPLCKRIVFSQGPGTDTTYMPGNSKRRLFIPEHYCARAPASAPPRIFLNMQT